MGDLRSALETLDRTESEAEADEYLAADLALQRADLLADLNDFEPAVEFYRKAKAGYAQLHDPAGEAEAEQGSDISTWRVKITTRPRSRSPKRCRSRRASLMRDRAR